MTTKLAYVLFRIRVWWHLRKLAKVINALRKQSPQEAAPVLTRWKWQIAHRYPEYLRGAYLDALATFEKAHHAEWAARHPGLN